MTSVPTDTALTITPAVGTHSRRLNQPMSPGRESSLANIEASNCSSMSSRRSASDAAKMSRSSPRSGTEEPGDRSRNTYTSDR